MDKERVIIMGEKKKSRIAALTLTAVNFLIYGALAAIVVAFMVSSSLYDVEAFTLMGFQLAVYVLLFVSLLLKKDNLLLGVLVAAMAYSLIVCLKTDFTNVGSLPSVYQTDWSYGLSSTLCLASDLALIVGIVILFYELLSGDGSSCSKKTMIPFIVYLGLSALALVFSFVYFVRTSFHDIDLLPIINILSALNQIFILYACFYKKEEA